MLAYYVVGGVVLAGFIVLIPVGYTIRSYITYAYVNSRLRARQNRFIEADQFNQYARRSFQDIIYDIAEKYGLDLTEHLQPEITYSELDNAIRSHHIEDIKAVQRFAPQEYDDFMNAYLDRFTIRIIKNALRKQNASLAEQTRRLPSPKQFSISFRQNKQPTFQDLEEELRNTRYGDILSDHKEALTNNEYEVFETELNQAYLEKLYYDAPTNNATQFVRRLIDQVNITAALNNTDSFAKHGTIPKESLENAENTEEIKQVLNNHDYNTDGTTPAQIEQSIREDMQSFAETLKNRQPLSDNIILSYLIQKDHNMQNLNVLLKLSYHKTNPDDIQAAITV